MRVRVFAHVCGAHALFMHMPTQLPNLHRTNLHLLVTGSSGSPSEADAGAEGEFPLLQHFKTTRRLVQRPQQSHKRKRNANSNSSSVSADDASSDAISDGVITHIMRLPWAQCDSSGSRWAARFAGYNDLYYVDFDSLIDDSDYGESGGFMGPAVDEAMRVAWREVSYPYRRAG